MLSLIKNAPGPIKHIYNFINDKDYRKWSKLETKLRRYPRYKHIEIKINGFDLFVPDSLSFLSTYKEIFQKKTYMFHTDNIEPYIIDVGANIGLSVLFFKKEFPDATILAIEADPTIFQYLEKNVHGNGFTDVKLLNKAAWHENSVLKFSSEGADAGRIAYEGDENLISIESINIAPLIAENQVDLLKIDIEGAEKKVLEACKHQLHNVRNLIVEYHSRADKDQQLASILQILHDAGFRYHIHTVNPNPNPLVERRTPYGFDLQLNIFAWRENQ